MEFEWKKKKDRGTFPQLLEQKSTTWIDMHHRGVIPRIIVIIIIVLRTLQTIVVRKCRSRRSQADQMLHLALWCCRDVDHPQWFTRSSNSIPSAVHTRIRWTLFLYVYIYIYIYRRCIFVVKETLHRFGEMQLWTTNSADHTLIRYTRSMYV